MSRSAKDATRFTATAPHVYSKPAPTIPPKFPQPQIPNASIPSSGLANETPAQKVARLRATHAAKRASEISSWDRVVVRGRIIADAAHRYTVLSLLGLTFVAGGVTVFSLGDMIVYNRRKRKAYFEEQTVLREARLIDARAAAATGTADEDQVLLLNQEQARETSEAAQKEKKSVLGSITGTLFSTKGLKQEDEGLDRTAERTSQEAAGGATNEKAAELVDRSRKAQPGSNILRAVEERRRAGEKELESRGTEGGSLDRMAGQAAERAAQSGGGWTSWMTRN